MSASIDRSFCAFDLSKTYSSEGFKFIADFLYRATADTNPDVSGRAQTLLYWAEILPGETTFSWEPCEEGMIPIAHTYGGNATCCPFLQ